MGSQHKESELDGLRVLVVEDNDDSREMLTELLSLSGADCRAAGGAAVARKILVDGGWEPDVILSDISMPAEDGLSFGRWVQSRRPVRARPPMIAVTAQSDRQATFDAGFVLHVMKPVHLSELLGAISLVRPPRGRSERARPTRTRRRK